MTTAHNPPQQPCSGTQAPESTQPEPSTGKKPVPGAPAASSPCLLDSDEEFDPRYLPDYPSPPKTDK